MLKNELDLIIKGEHPEPIKALGGMYFKGKLTLEEIQYKLTIPPKLRTMTIKYIAENEIITSQEAAMIWGLGESTLRTAFNNKDKRFNEGDYRKSGKIWLVKRSAMYKVYGEEKEELIMLNELKKLVGKEMTLLEMDNEVLDLVDGISLFEYGREYWGEGSFSYLDKYNVLFDIIEENDDPLEILIKVTNVEEI